ncbi:MAG: aminotransferase class I/II-fold pyridoxal phosphate-dependent enzyme, partial [Bacteroidota bacterium]
MPGISSRAQKTPLSPFRALIPVADAAKANGAHVYHLNIGQPDIPTPPQAWRAVREDTQDILAYSPAAGIMPYRRALVDYYRRFDIELTAEQILVTTGASEGLLFAMLCCLDEGDEVIIPEPFYANYNGFAHIANVKIKPVTCHLRDGFALPAVEDFAAQ